MGFTHTRYRRRSQSRSSRSIIVIARTVRPNGCIGIRIRMGIRTTFAPVLLAVLEGEYFLSAPTQVFELPVSIRRVYCTAGLPTPTDAVYVTPSSQIVSWP